MADINLNARMSQEDGIQEDINLCKDYVKERLFYKSIFLYSDDDLKSGSRLYQDYIKEMKPLLAHKCLPGKPEVEATAYLNFVWEKLVNKKCYREWLSLKRSNCYQSVQDKFISKCDGYKRP
jgi:hypothetical protein